MLFNSLDFFVFFIIVYSAYLALGTRYREQNFLLLVGSYVFYGWWDWRFVPLLAGVTALNHYLAGRIYSEESPAIKKRCITISVAVSFAILGFFKYFNFFIESAEQALNSVGFHADVATLNILLPVGISFYTFHILSYTIDVYRGALKPTERFEDFALFAAFFPLLLAGPIERASNILPQITAPRKIRPDKADAGVFLILWGLFKKMAVADNMAVVANKIFDNNGQYHGLDIVIGILAFTAQIYCDFSGYSDMARGLARLMGFELMLNFRLPYFARNPREFWQRWHISLSTWLRDYLYIPLGGNRDGELARYRNLVITMLLCGLWHGAAWHFVAWGAYHAALQVAHNLFISARKTSSSEAWEDSLSRVAMFIFVAIGWTLFRAPTVGQAASMLMSAGISVSSETLALAKHLAFYAAPLVIVQAWQHLSGDLLAPMKLKPAKKSLLYAFMILWIFIFGVRESVEFIYFQF